MPRAEITRQFVHIGAGALALSLAWLTWWQAAILACAAILFNGLALPRIIPSVCRDGDRRRPWQSGLVLYPASVLVLVLVFRDRLDLTAAAWGVLAAGDGLATLAGISMRSVPLPWNRDKTVAGLAAFIAGGAPAAIGLLAWTSGLPLSTGMIVTGALTAVVAGLAETLPIRLDDNLTVPAVAALTLWSCSLFDPGALDARWPVTLDLQIMLLMGAIGNAGVALLGWFARTVTVSGAVTGAVIGTMVVAGTGWRGWLLLIATFMLASATTRMGRRRKEATGIAEPRGGRRGPGNAIANTGLMAWASVVAVGLHDPTPAWLAGVAALVTAGSDTVASEVGKAWGRTTRMVTTLRRVAPGTTGAVSLEGTAAGITSAALLAAGAAGLGLVPTWTIGLITLAATVASLIEGGLGATLEARGILDNDTLNFVNAAMGAALTLAAWTWWPAS